MEDQLGSLEEELRLNVRIRVETNERLKDTIEDLNAELANRVQYETKEREHSNHCMLTLLEESCNRIENYFAQSV